MMQRKTPLLTLAWIAAGAAAVWAATAPSDSARDPDVAAVQRRLTDLERRVLALESRPTPPIRPGKPRGATPKDPSDRPDVERLDKRLDDLEQRIERLEKGLPSVSVLPRLPRSPDGPAPRGWLPWEFNGRTYYWIPLSPGADHTCPAPDRSGQGNP
ncbi:MAG: hypothetical protein KBE04_03235 [Phycisphaerae bacterium]|nr:hypothetical protein [Phycisphaerae bacterium]